VAGRDSDVERSGVALANARDALSQLGRNDDGYWEAVAAFKKRRTRTRDRPAGAARTIARSRSTLATSSVTPRATSHRTR
jgi:hypothetical protein